MAAESRRTVGFFELQETVAPVVSDEGDATGRAHVQRRLDDLGRCVAQASGRVIKQIGDELMCAFDSSEAAVRLAIDYQNRVDQQDRDQGCVALRAGLHEGPVVEEDGDLFGDTVNVAARVTSIARPGQLLVTQEVVSTLPEDLVEAARLFDEVRVKGSLKSRSLYRMLWMPRSETLGHTQMPALRARPETGVLTLHLSDADLEVPDDGTEVRLGRDARCELVVPSDKASRFHATVGVEGGKFVLRDQSTNGTWVRMQGSPVVTLRREALALYGEGIISLGVAVGRDGSHLIRFTCR